MGEKGGGGGAKPFNPPVALSLFYFLALKTATRFFVLLGILSQFIRNFMLIPNMKSYRIFLAKCTTAVNIEKHLLQSRKINPLYRRHPQTLHIRQL